MTGRRRAKREEPDPGPRTLGQLRTKWRSDAPFTANNMLAGPGPHSVQGSLDTFATISDIDAITADAERFLAWLKEYPR